jgi:hypothetical protein
MARIRLGYPVRHISTGETQRHSDLDGRKPFFCAAAEKFASLLQEILHDIRVSIVVLATAIGGSLGGDPGRRRLCGDGMGRQRSSPRQSCAMIVSALQDMTPQQVNATNSDNPSPLILRES